MVSQEIRSYPETSVTRPREIGYSNVMMAAGLADRIRIIRVPNDGPDRDLEISRLLSSPDRPRAIFCWSDLHGVQLLNQAKMMGIAVPDDLAIVAYDNYVGSYLSARHRDNAAGGCPTASLAASVRHQTPAARSAMTEGLRSQIDRIGKALPKPGAADSRRIAIGSWAAMVGAVILARSIDDPELADEVLEQTRAWIYTSAN